MFNSANALCRLFARQDPRTARTMRSLVPAVIFNVTTTLAILNWADPKKSATVNEPSASAPSLKNHP